MLRLFQAVGQLAVSMFFVIWLVIVLFNSMAGLVGGGMVTCSRRVATCPFGLFNFNHIAFVVVNRVTTLVCPCLLVEIFRQ